MRKVIKVLVAVVIDDDDPRCCGRGCGHFRLSERKCTLFDRRLDYVKVGPARQYLRCAACKREA